MQDIFITPININKKSNSKINFIREIKNVFLNNDNNYHWNDNKNNKSKEEDYFIFFNKYKGISFHVIEEILDPSDYRDYWIECENQNIKNVLKMSKEIFWCPWEDLCSDFRYLNLQSTTRIVKNKNILLNFINNNNKLKEFKKEHLVNVDLFIITLNSREYVMYKKQIREAYNEYNDFELTIFNDNIIINDIIIFKTNEYIKFYFVKNIKKKIIYLTREFFSSKIDNKLKNILSSFNEPYISTRAIIKSKQNIIKFLKDNYDNFYNIKELNELKI